MFAGAHAGEVQNPYDPILSWSSTAMAGRVPRALELAEARNRSLDSSSGGRGGEGSGWGQGSKKVYTSKNAIWQFTNYYIKLFTVPTIVEFDCTCAVCTTVYVHSTYHPAR